MILQKVTRKSMLIRPSGRSTDFISPSFGYGCLYNCSYCYMKRHKPDGLSISTNTGDILTAINNHAYFTPVEKPNQTHADYTTLVVTKTLHCMLNIMIGKISLSFLELILLRWVHLLLSMLILI